MDFRMAALGGGCFFLGVVFTYMLSLLKWVLIDYLDPVYAFVFLCAGLLGLGSSFSDGRLRWMMDNRGRLSKGMEVAAAMMPKPDLSSSPFSIADSGESASLIYSRMGHQYLLNVPFNSSHRRISNRIKVHLVMKLGDGIDVTQQPCVPYLCTALQLGGIGYRITDKGTGDLIKEYEEDVLIDLDEVAAAL